MSKLLTGFVAGIVVGILVAPDKGSETRKRITERTNDFKEKVEDLVCSIKDKFSTTVEEVEELKADLQYDVNRFKDDTASAWSTQP